MISESKSRNFIENLILKKKIERLKKNYLKKDLLKKCCNLGYSPN